MTEQSVRRVEERSSENVPVAMVVSRNGNVHSPGDLTSLVQSFVALRSGPASNGFYAFTSATPREGVTYTVNTVGTQLATYVGGDILIVQASTLPLLTARAVEAGATTFREVRPGLWVQSGEWSTALAGTTGRVASETWTALSKRFAYVLIDCQTLSHSAEILSLSDDIMGVYWWWPPGRDASSNCSRPLVC